MNFNDLPIGNIIGATESQFIALYQQTQPKEYTQSEYVEQFKCRQKLAMKDAEDLKQLGVSSQQISGKLYNIIEKAKDAYKLSLTKPFNLLSPNFERAIIDVEENGSFRVFDFNIREMRMEKCVLCDHNISGPATYQIENLTTHESISFPELTLHLIRTHEYFAKPGYYRLEPSRVCQVLELVN